MARLIINADDFGLFPWVTAGILAAARAGTVTATAIMANSPDFDAAAAALRERTQVDAGVHLNATQGMPLTDSIPRWLRAPDGSLPPKGRLLRALLLRQLSPQAVGAEWRAQIERCVAAGLRPCFLNSHEHLHMLPALTRIARQLARDHGIRYVRHSAAALAFNAGITGLLRTSVLASLALIGPAPMPDSPRLLGLGSSGRLDLVAIEKIISGLQCDRTYELMCHPGQQPGTGVARTAQLRYHDWVGELDCLMSARLRELLAASAVRLIGYRELATNG